MQRHKFKILCVVVLVAILAFVGWYKFFRVVPQPAFTSEEEWFKYGSLGGEAKTGIPYWIWLELPRVFPDLLPGPGGYASFGMSWEPGRETPIGSAKKTMGFPRVTQNCAMCHVTTYRLSPDQSSPTIVVGAGSRSFNLQKFARFLGQVAADPRFNADTLMAAIAQETKLSLFDRLAYRFAIIPLTRKALLKQAQQFAWIDAPGRTVWGPGRDDPFNLPKFMVAFMPDDGSVGQTNFVSIWRLDKIKANGAWLNLGAESPTSRTVIVDSSFGFGPSPGKAYEADIARLEAFLTNLKPPPWPYAEGPNAIDAQRADQGRKIYQANCADCHEPGGSRYGKDVPLVEIGTDPERANTWTRDAVNKVNHSVEALGFVRPLLAKNDGYLSGPLDGLWLRAPYLHNGSVPNLRELLSPESGRSAVFYRGYDVIDPQNVGYVVTGTEAERVGYRLDTHERGNGNRGHLYGTALSAAEKDALIEYLKTL
jgi:mono/diheme cytochrome c family protein